MIKYLLNNEIDKIKWDAVIQGSFNQLLYAYSWYLDIVSPNWEALILNDYDAVMPLTLKQKFGISYLFNPYFVQQLGVFSIKPINDIVIWKFIQAIPQKFRLIDINFNSKNNISNSIKGQTDFQNFELSLNFKYDYLKSKYKGNTKRNIKKSNKFNLKIVDNIDIHSVVELFKSDKGKELTRIKSCDYDRFKSLAVEAEKRITVLKLGVINEQGILITGAILFNNNNRIIFIFSGNSKIGKNYSAMYFLLDYVIKQYSEKEIILDFEGGNIPGLAYFYSGFGSRNIHYTNLKVNKLPSLLKVFKR